MFHAAADQSYVGAGLSQRARDAASNTSAAASHKRDVAFQNSIGKEFVTHYFPEEPKAISLKVPSKSGRSLVERRR
jgi:hypothetical protein